MRTFIGIDNGISGSIGVIRDGKAFSYIHTPTKVELSYTKEKQYVTRIDVPVLQEYLKQFKEDEVVLALERPMINPARWKATQSALRSLEASLIVFEALQLPYNFIDSKHWQKELLPHGVEEGKELKNASLQVGKRMFPSLDFTDFEDADGILIAEYLRRHYIS